MPLTPETHTFKTVADCHINADVYRHSGGSASTAAIVYIHGGCLIYGSRKDINPGQLELYLEHFNLNYSRMRQTNLGYLHG